MAYKGKYISVIIPAAGTGSRMNTKINKQFILLNDKPVLAHTIEKFNNCKYVDEIILVLKQNEIDYCRKEIIHKYKYNKVVKIITGGKERQDSVYNGLLEVSNNKSIVLIHDGARPFITENDIINCIEGVIQYGCCVLGVPVKDTIKIVDDKRNVVDTPERKKLWAVQTPQSFYYNTILDAHKKAKKDNIVATDDSMLVERIGEKVHMIMGNYRNIKITTIEDLNLALSFLNDGREVQ